MVSILMTSYNREDYISEAIESVLASTYKEFELIIVDDCSKDRTVEMARKYEAADRRVKVYVNEYNLGDYHNRNKAADYATGKYIKYIDSDDLIYPHGLEVMVRAMERFPLAGLGIIGRNNQESNPYPILLSPLDSYRKHFFGNGLFDTGPTGLIFRAEAFKSIGRFSGKRFVGDTEINLRLSANWSVVLISSSLVFWRIHCGQEFVLGNATTGYLELSLPMLKAELAKPECPLDASEIKRILDYNKGVSARHIVKVALQKRSLKKGVLLSRQLGLGIGDFINAIFLSKVI